MKAFINNLKNVVIPLLVMILSSSLVLASEEHHAGNPAPDLATSYRAMNFALLLLLLFFALRKPLVEFFKERAVSFKLAVGDSQAALTSALKDKNEIDAKLKSLSAESASLLQSTIKDAKDEAEKLVSQANVFAGKMKEDAQKLLVSEVRRAKEELRILIVDLASVATEELLKKTLDASKQEQVMSRAIGNFGNPL